MEARILSSVKKTLDIAATDTSFDEDVIIHINSAFSTLNQLGIGPVEGFEIENDTAVWDDLLRSNPRFNSIKTYVHLAVRLVFDPPKTSYEIDSLKRQLDELTWRLNVLREETGWIDPNPLIIDDEEV